MTFWRATTSSHSLRGKSPPLACRPSPHKGGDDTRRAAASSNLPAELTNELGGTVRHGEPTPLWEGGEQSEREGSLLLNQRAPTHDRPPLRDLRLSIRAGGGALIGVLFFMAVVAVIPFALART